jgi:hypothetical protein
MTAALSAFAAVSAAAADAVAAAHRELHGGHTHFSVPAEKQFAWADAVASPFTAGATIAIVHMRTPRAALRSLAPHAATPIESPRKVERWAERGSYLQARNSIEALPLGHHWTLIVNELGYRATLHRRLRRLSAHGYAYVMFEDVNFDTSYQVAQHGKILREFDPFLYDRPWIGHPSKAERHIRFNDRRDWHTMAKCMLLTYRLSGIRLTPKAVSSQRHRIAVGVHG